MTTSLQKNIHLLGKIKAILKLYYFFQQMSNLLQHRTYILQLIGHLLQQVTHLLGILVYFVVFVKSLTILFLMMHKSVEIIFVYLLFVNKIFIVKRKDNTKLQGDIKYLKYKQYQVNLLNKPF